jgi:NAD(P)-dependent dehydrogenase (short-subunit alcohol dehydrogenase family)
MVHGMIALVTGATSGIGRWTALGLAHMGIRVLAHGRDPKRGEALRRFIAGRVPGASMELVYADLSRLSEVRQLAQQAQTMAPHLNLLVNNAGTMAKMRQLTADGIERVLAVDHLAPFVLTQALLPLLKAAAPGTRVVNVGSSISDHATIRPYDLQLTRGWTARRAYSQSKLAMMICSFEMARRLAGHDVSVNVVHPGVVATRIGNLGGRFGLLWEIGKPFMRSSERGAENTLFVATEPTLAGVTGRYFKDCALAAPNPLALDRGLASWLWTETERLTGQAP